MLSSWLRPVLVRALLLIVSTGICLLGLELVLRVQPSLLGEVFANGVLNKYHTGPGGIYYRDPKLRIHFMIPNLKTQMHYNGYVWTHESDAYGFRNKRTVIPADFMLLGDSFIYGHGVDFEFTVGYFLEQLTGRPVVNLARQGDSSFQEAYLLTEYIRVFRPRVVFYMFSFNDISDLTAFLTRAEMQAFIDQPVESIRYPPRTDVTQARSPSLIRRLARASYLVKAYRWLKWRLGVGPALAAEEGPDEENSLEWRYTKKAIAYMQYVAAKHGAQLVIAPISPFGGRDFEILRRTATAYGLPLVDTSSFTVADASLWLPRDGHFSPAGARRMAELLADYARQRK
jgi:lysophospholipase L1-like esterase